MSIRTHVTFKSAAFNTTEQKDGFINPDNFGDDVARWLMEKLRAGGCEVAEHLGQEDHGWFFTFSAGGQEHDFVVGSREDDEPDWVGWIERRAGFVASLLGGRKKGIQPEAVQAIDAVLSGSEQIHDVRWHFEKDLMAGREELGQSKPTSN